MNHTSDQHPWFQAARSSPRLAVPRLLRLARREAAGEARRRRLPRPGELQLGLRPRRPGSTTCTASTPTSPTSTSPTPRSATSSRRSIGFWLEQGLAGFRVDAVPFLIEPIGMPEGAIDDPHELAARPARVPEPPQRRRGPARRGQPAAASSCASSSATRTATSCTWCSTSSATRRSTCRWRAATAEPLARGAARRSRSSPTTASLGALRAQPRRADARQALRATSAQEVFARFGPDPDMQLYGRGLRRRLPTMLDGDERAHPDGLLARVLAARHAGAVLRRGDRDGREPRHRGPLRRARADAVVGDRHGGFSTADASSLRRPLVDGRVRARARQRRRPAARPGLAAELVRAPHPPPPRVPGARLRDADAAGRPARRRCSPTAATGRARRSSPSTSSPATPVDGRAAGRGRRGARRPLRRTRSTRCPRRSTSSPTPRTGSACAARACGFRRRSIASACSLSNWRRSRLVGRALRSTPCGRVIRISATRARARARLSSVSA